jgi:hypothetical protein
MRDSVVLKTLSSASWVEIQIPLIELSVSLIESSFYTKIDLPNDYFAFAFRANGNEPFEHDSIFYWNQPAGLWRKIWL